MKNIISQNGFTFIELLIVIAVMAILSAISVASFSSYATAQKLTTNVFDVKNTLQYAKSQAMSQANTCPTGQQFIGYKVLVCCQGNSCPSCLSPNNYEVDLVCSGGDSFVNGKKLSQGITIDVANTTTFSILFSPLSGMATGAGTILFKQGTSSKSIIINGVGVIE